MFARIAAFLLLAVLSVQAQQPRNIEFRTLCFAYSNSIRSVTLAGDPAGEITTEAKLLKYLNSRQTPFSVVGNTLFVGERTDEGFDSWNQVDLPKGASQILLVFFPSGNKEKPYNIKAFDDSEKNFPLASYQITNMSPKTIRLIIGEVPVEIAPGGSKNIADFKNVRANGQVPYYAYSKNGSDWDRLSTGFWQVIDKERNFQIAWLNPRTRSVEMRGFEDSLPVVRATRARSAR